MTTTYPRATDSLERYVLDDEFREALHQKFDAQRDALPLLTEAEYRFVDAITERPLATIEDAATLAGFSEAMGATMVKDERILAHLDFHAASTRFAKLLRAVVELRVAAGETTDA